MNLSLEFLERCSAESGFQLSALERVTRLGEVARSIAEDPMLGQAFALKGGTALNLCFGPPSRLSVDLDFNYIATEARDAMFAERPRVREALLALTSRLGYRVQESAGAFSGSKIFLSYRSAMGTPDRIEIDLNFLFRVPFSGVLIRPLWQPSGLDQPAVSVVGISELLVGKLLALLDRGALRDIWDIANLPTQMREVAQSNEFRRHFIAFSATLPHPLTTYTRRRLETLATGKMLAEQLVPMLIRNEPVDVDSLVVRAWDEIAHLLQPRDYETAYLAAIERGEVRTGLIFPDDVEQANLLARHPAILWKTKNVRERLGLSD